VAALRTFIAIGVPPAVLDTIIRIQSRFRSLGLRASWVKPGNIHLTLKFLGETDPDRISGIQNKLTEILASFTTFRLSLDSVGIFPNTKNPRILWIGLKHDEGTLQTFQSSIEKAMEGMGFPMDPQPFAPHLTLARMKFPKGNKELQNQLDAVNQEGIDPHPFDVGEIHLYESQLTPKGSIYTVLANFKLNP